MAEVLPPACDNFRGGLTCSAHLHWALLGLGCTWFLGDSTVLEVPWWVDSQPEGVKVSARIALASSMAPIAAAAGLLFRICAPRAFFVLIVPLMIVFSLLAGYLLVLNLWQYNSFPIYASVALSQTVGTMLPFGVLPWMVAKKFDPALISTLNIGGSVGSLSASLLVMMQAPGSVRRFTPEVYFLAITSPVLMSLAAYCRIVVLNLGSTDPTHVGTLLFFSAADVDALGTNVLGTSVLGTSVLGTSVVMGRLSVWLPRNFRVWVRSALILASASSFMAIGSWCLVRAALPFAITHTVHGHAACAPDCSVLCSSLTFDRCAELQACRWMHSEHTCIENHAEEYLEWSTSLSQWAFAGGVCFTAMLPTKRIFFVPLVWMLPVALISAAASDREGLFEFRSAGLVVLCSLLLSRFCQGYFEVMQYRYIADKYGSDAEAVVVFVGILLLASGLLGGVATQFVVDTGLFAD